MKLTVNRIRMLIVLSAVLLIASVATGAPHIVTTMSAVLPGAWIGGWISTTALRIAEARRDAARARRRAARAARRKARGVTAHPPCSLSTSTPIRATMLARIA